MAWRWAAITGRFRKLRTHPTEPKHGWLATSDVTSEWNFLLLMGFLRCTGAPVEIGSDSFEVKGAGIRLYIAALQNRQAYTN